MRTSRDAALAAIGLIFTLYLQSVMNFPHQPRFTSSALNYWAVAFAALLLPVLIGLVALTLPQARRRRFGVILAGLLGLPCFFVSSCAALDAPALASSDLSYELLSEARSDSTVWRLYRTNCGATCAFGLDLREERELLGGIKLVSPKWSQYRASEGVLQLEGTKVRVVDDGALLVEFNR
jgi:hypothetical protein